MTVRNHAVVWVDHLLAKVFSMGVNAVDELTIHAHLTSANLHHKANSIGSGKVHEDPTFFSRIGEVLQASDAILILGPGNEKTLLLKYLKGSLCSAKERNLHTESCDHLSDREIIALGRKHFHLGEPARLEP